MPEYDSLLPVHTADLDEVQEVVADDPRVIGDDRLMIAEVYALDRAARALLRRGRARRAPAVQHAPDLDRVGRRGDRRADRALRGRAAGGRVAELGARQPRPPADRQPRRRRPGARGGDAAADAARHADAVLRRRARDGGRADRAHGRPRHGARSRAHADALGRRAARRLQHGRAVAAGGGRRRRRRPARRPALDADAATARCSRCGASSPRPATARSTPRRRARLRARRAHRRRAQPDRRAAPAAGRRRDRAEHAPRRRRRGLRPHEGVVLTI